MENNTAKEAQTSDTRKKNIIKIAGAILIIVVIAAIIGRGTSKAPVQQPADAGMPDGCKPGYLFSETTGKPCPKDETTQAPQTAPATVSGYEEAVKSYGGKVVLFDGACKSLTTIAPQTVGTRILIANNSDKQLTIAVPGRTQILDSYRYFTYPLKASGAVTVTCGGAPAVVVTVK